MANLCELYPCHEYVFSGFNCEYCYCPLYKEDCEQFNGNPKFLKTRQGDIKNCCDCILPHTPEFKKEYNSKISFVKD